MGDAAPVLVPDAPPLLDVHVAVYEVIASPLSAGTVNATDAVPSPVVTAPIPGGLGTPAGTIAADAGDAGLVPTPLVAVTLHV